MQNWLLANGIRSLVIIRQEEMQRTTYDMPYMKRWRALELTIVFSGRKCGFVPEGWIGCSVVCEDLICDFEAQGLWTPLPEIAVSFG